MNPAEADSLVDELLDDYIAHFGVKGMKWGVRNNDGPKYGVRQDKGHEFEKVKTKKLAKLDQKWEKSVYSLDGAVKVHNAVADKMNNGMLDRFNNQPKFKSAKGGPLNDFRVRPEYLREYERLCVKAYTEVVPQIHGINPSGTKKAVYKAADENGPERIEIVDVAAAHAGTIDAPPITLILKSDNGMFTKVNTAELMHSVDLLLEDYIAHYGVKGQKWGVRRTPKQLGKSSEDFERAFAARTKATTQGRHTLSNKELQDAITRMNLERQYASLTAPTPATKQFVVGLIKDVGRETLKSLLRDQVKSVVKVAGNSLGNAAASTVNIPVNSIGITK